MERLKRENLALRDRLSKFTDVWPGVHTEIFIYRRVKHKQNRKRGGKTKRAVKKTKKRVKMNVRSAILYLNTCVPAYLTNDVRIDFSYTRENNSNVLEQRFNLSFELKNGRYYHKSNTYKMYHKDVV